MHEFLRLVKESSEARVTFAAYDLLKTILIIGSRKTIGRKNLSRELEVGEGVIRTILNRLREKGYVETSMRGYRLTEKGGDIYSKLRGNLEIVETVKLKSVKIWKTYSGVLIRGRANRVSSGIEQRDAAIRGGADGAITITCVGGRVSMPGLEKCEDFERLLEEIKSVFKPRDGDVIIVAGGKTCRASRVGAVNAALTLL